MDCNLSTCPAYIKAEQNEKDIEDIKSMRIEGRLSKIETTLEQLSRDIRTLIEQPSRRWEMIIGALIVGGVGIIAEVVFK